MFLSSASKTNPLVSENNALSALKSVKPKSISVPIVPSASPPKIISEIVVANPPSLMSWHDKSKPALIASITA